MKNEMPSKKVKALADYVEGFAEATHNPKLKEAAEYLDRLSDHICAGDIIGCDGGDKCTSDHK